MEPVAEKARMSFGSEPLDSPVMLTMSNMTASSERPLTLAAAPVMVVHGRRKGSLVWKLIGVCMIAILSGFNAWWYWRDTRSLPDLKTVSDWMRHEQYVQAESVLREHLRRSPHDGEARMMLARALAGRGDLLGCARQLHEIPFWWPQKAEALLREGQSYFKIDRAKDAEAAWLERDQGRPASPHLRGPLSRRLSGAAETLRHRRSLGGCLSGHVDGLRSRFSG